MSREFYLSCNYEISFIPDTNIEVSVAKTGNKVNCCKISRVSKSCAKIESK